jgi:hypothetical protein
MTTIFDQTPGVEYLDEATGVPPSAFAAEAEAEAEAPRKRGGGARTAAGRERCKRNSVDHSLTSKTVFDEAMVQEIARCTAEIVAEFQPRSEYQHRMAGELGRLTAQLERCELTLMALEKEQMTHAADPDCWDSDRCKPIDQLAAGLGRDPLRVSRELERTKQGTEWLTLNWQRLADALRVDGGWTEAQRERAFDLLGYPHDFRPGSSAVPAGDCTAGLALLVERELTRLLDRLSRWLIDLDERQRQRAEQGLSMEEDADTKKFRKYKRELNRDRNRTRAELLRALSQGDPADTSPAPAPAPNAAPGPEPAPAGRATPPEQEPSRADLLKRIQQREEEARQVRVIVDSCREMGIPLPGNRIFDQFRPRSHSPAAPGETPAPAAADRSPEAAPRQDR